MCKIKMDWRYGLVACLLFLQCKVYANTPTQLEISQAQSTGTAITLHASVRGEAEAPIPGLPAEAFSATVGAENAAVESVDFAPADQGMGYILLVDVSRSLRAEPFETIKQALTGWVDGLGAADRAALIEFGEGVRTLSAFTDDQEALKSAIGELALTDDKTYLHQALVRAMNLGRQEVEGVPRRRAIITLTDGLDDVAGGVTEEEVFEAMEEGAAPIYAIGFSRTGQDNEEGFKALGRFARASGGAFVDGMSSSVEAAYGRIRELIGEQYRIRLSCEACVADGGLYPVQLVLRSEGATLRDSIDLRLFPADPTQAPESESSADPGEQAPEAPTAEEEAAETPPEREPIGGEPGQAESPPAPAPAPWWQRPEVLAGGGVLLALLLFFGLRSRKKEEPAEDEPAAGPPPSAAESVTRATTPAPVQTPQSAPPTEPRIRLTPLGGGEARALALPAELGRAPSNHWSAPQDDTLSARHARILERDERVLLEDLGSTNGTFLNGVRIHAPSPLQDGDLIRLGELELRIQLLGDD